MVLGANGVADVNFFHAGEDHDVAGLDLIDLLELHAFIDLDLGHFERNLVAVETDTDQPLLGPGRAVEHLAHGETPQIV